MCSSIHVLTAVVSVSDGEGRVRNPKWSNVKASKRETLYSCSGLTWSAIGSGSSDCGNHGDCRTWKRAGKK